jgi:hypothetical protein
LTKPNLIEYFRARTNRSLITDTFCFLFITPLALLASIFCIRGAIWQLKVRGHPVDAFPLITIGIFLALVYLIWALLTIKHHVFSFIQWREENPIITLTDSSSAAPSIIIDLDGHSDVNANELNQIYMPRVLSPIRHIDISEVVIDHHELNTNQRTSRASNLMLPIRNIIMQHLRPRSPLSSSLGSYRSNRRDI